MRGSPGTLDYLRHVTAERIQAIVDPWILSFRSFQNQVLFVFLHDVVLTRR